jgi:hypothetical protein
VVTRERLIELLGLWRTERAHRRREWGESPSQDTAAALGEAVGRCNMLGALLGAPNSDLRPIDANMRAVARRRAEETEVPW